MAARCHEERLELRAQDVKRGATHCVLEVLWKKSRVPDCWVWTAVACNNHALIEEARMLSVDLDISINMSKSYLDVHIRLHLSRQMFFNVYILAVLVYKWHTTEVVLDRAEVAVDVLYPFCRYKIIGISTDRERHMIGRVTGIATWIEALAKDHSQSRVVRCSSR